MLANILIVGGLFILAVLFVWLTIRALKITRAVLKWPAAILAGLLTLFVFAITALVLTGFYRLNVAPYRYSFRDIPVDNTSEVVQRGEKFANICIDCHSSTGELPLDGGKENILTGDLPLGELYAPNLTPAGPVKDWSDAEILRAMREGIDNKGRPLVAMPSQALHYASDADAAAILAYLRSQPAVNHDLPPRNLSVLAALMVGAGLFPTSAQTPILEPVTAPEPGSAEYGAYMAASLGCPDCHGKDLAGLSGGPGPAGPNLTAIVPAWEEKEFMVLFREGRDPSGRQITDSMPWKNYGKALSDDDLKVLYRYLSSLQRVEKSTR